MKALAPRITGAGVSRFTFALSWLAMTAVVTVLNALPTKRDELPRNRPTPPPAVRR